ncbi:LysE family translocator [Paralimibaculum aggregatum]|uniref:LysE family translocator n=1 Tax=Paralimibaculum aggregatum TaxID=3036245 RepID=A0ABQ6LCN5_9RHOB|nr:LysE family translocator [Limibaculum sp. NKW23]GMG81121.1 LysE family translocator [Limibaculum sp. NKW23]
MTIDTLLALAGFAFAAAWTPGPNNMMLAASGATFGWRATLGHALGVSLGFALMIFLIALGLGEVFQRSETLRIGLAWGGGAVMLWLAWRIATAGPARTGRRSRPLNFLEASAFQWINPKAWVMAIGAAATFASGAAPLREASVVAAVFLLAGLTGTQVWSGFGATLGRLLGDGWALRAFNVTMGVMLAASALWMVRDGMVGTGAP